MNNNKRTNRHQFFLIIIILIFVMAIIGLGVTLFYLDDRFISPVSPVGMQAVEDDGFDNLDGGGEIEWYEGFFVWDPSTKAVSYPFITGTLTILWEDIDTGLMPVAIPYTTTQLVVELELRGIETYTQTIKSELSGLPQPGTGIFDSLIWIWIDVAPGDYDEYIKLFWQVGNERVPIHLVRDGEIVGPSTGFRLNRESLTIPHLIYLPVVAK